MMNYIDEPARKIEVVKETDVLVLGGGIAGVSAALAARRQGARVILLEKEFGLGGLATLGNVLIYLPLCDGRGRQVIGGLGEELLHLSMKSTRPGDRDLGFFPAPECWTGEGTQEERSQKRYNCGFNPAAFQIDLEEILIKEGVDIWYDTRFSSCLLEKERISHAIVENKSGRMAIKSRAFVDASGDADLCTAAEEGVATWDHNVLCGWHYLLIDGKLTLQAFSKKYKFTARGEECEGLHLDGHTGKSVTRQVLESRKLIKERVDAKRKDHGDKEIQPFALSSIPSFRATRRLNNSFALKEAHRHKYFEDTIGLTGDWRQSGPVYSIPLRSIQGEKNPNLFAAGRCISADIDVWDVTRVIPTCAVTGEAAGTAAAMTALKGGEINVKILQENLAANGVLLDRDLVKEAGKLE
jgi:hypothetical protein